MLLGIGAVAVVGLLVAGVFGARNLLATPAGPPATSTSSSQAPVGSLPPTAAPTVTEETSLAPIPAPGSLAVLADASLRLRLLGMPGAESSQSYVAWLTSSDGGYSLAGALQADGDQLNLFYENAGGEALLPGASGAEIWVGPAEAGEQPAGSPVLRLTPGDAEAALLAQLQAVGGGLPPGAAVLQGAPMQAGHFDSHLGFAVEALRAGDLTAAKRHSEHLINIVEGAAGQAFGDWNDDGRTENPGDDYGLLPYLQLLGSLLQPSIEDTASSEAERTSATQAQAEAERLAGLAAQARDLAERIAAADTAEEAQALGEQLSQMLIADAVQSLTDSAAPLPLGIRLEMLAATP